jgi:ssDNA-binding Zn-finger/Zn-ribbon topoisomerase 1
MTQFKAILAAQAIRPVLPELLDPETAAEIDRKLQILLTQTEIEQTINNQITEILREHETTQTWMRHYLKGETPEEITRAIVGLAGNMDAHSRKPEYQCPKCNTTKAELPQGRIPKCDAHPNATLQRISST